MCDLQPKIAKHPTKCNAAGCPKRFRCHGDPLGPDTIVCIGQTPDGRGLWYCLPCGARARYSDFSTTSCKDRVEQYARDDEEAEMFTSAIESGVPFCFRGVPGSGKSTKAVALYGCFGYEHVIAFAYNSAVAK